MLRRNGKPRPRGLGYIMGIMWLVAALFTNILVDVGHVQDFLNHRPLNNSDWLLTYLPLCLCFCPVWLVSLCIAATDFQTGGAPPVENNVPTHSSQSIMPPSRFINENIREGGLIAIWNHLFAALVTIVTVVTSQGS